MNVRRSFVRLTALTVVVAMPLLGMSGIASAKTAKAAKARPSAPSTRTGPSARTAAAVGPPVAATGGGARAASPCQVDPNPLVETGQSEIHAVIEVETFPAFAGDAVNIDSSQLVSSCDPPLRDSSAAASGTPVEPRPAAPPGPRRRRQRHRGRGRHRLRPGDRRGRGRPRSGPVLTASTTLVASPPVPTTAGLTGYPNPEVETGDTTGGINGPAATPTSTPCSTSRTTRSTPSSPWRSPPPSSRAAAAGLVVGAGQRWTPVTGPARRPTRGVNTGPSPRPPWTTTATPSSSSRAPRVPPGLAGDRRRPGRDHTTRSPSTTPSCLRQPTLPTV